ncbi:transposase [Streptomyces vinaceus]|uniref:transposase n=1 Tax=Streptomyces vinaceus TaxID=1960 RepID=UPI003809B211
MIDDIVREGARRMLVAAGEAELSSYLAELTDRRDESGRRLVVRNGYHQPRKVTTAVGVIEVKAPRINDKRINEATGERKRSALEQFLGSSAGLSPATVTRLTAQWQGDHKAFSERDLSATDYVYVWADGIHLRNIYNAEDKEHAVAVVKAFAKQYGAKFPKAVKKIVEDEDELLAFYDFPAEHWIHLRTTHPIDSTFATVRLRTKVTKDAGSRPAAPAMVFNLVESAQARWRAVNAPHLVALVRAGVRLERGQLAERPQATAA